MFGWIWQGLRTGIVTTVYPASTERQPEGVRNRLAVAADRLSFSEAEAGAEACPTKAIMLVDRSLRLDLSRCIQCGRCVESSRNGAFFFTSEYELAVRTMPDLVTEVDLP